MSVQGSTMPRTERRHKQREMRSRSTRKKEIIVGGRQKGHQGEPTKKGCNWKKNGEAMQAWNREVGVLRPTMLKTKEAM